MQPKTSKLNLQNLINYPFEKILVLSKTTSTNAVAKELFNNGVKSAVVVSESQTAGKGRLNRTFFSPKGKGVYLSVLLCPSISILNAPLITGFCGVQVANAIEKLSGAKTFLKWVNDLFINGKKVGGILTESGINASTKTLDYVIVGIGVNVYDCNYPEFIKDIATNIEKESGVKVDKTRLIAEIINGLLGLESAVESKDFLAEYKERQIILNKQVKVVLSNEEFYATAVDVDESGALIVIKDGVKRSVTVGDVSVRF